MASPRQYEAETLLPPNALADPATARSSVADSLGMPHSSYEMRESQYSSAPFNPYADTGASTPRDSTPAPYQDDPSVEKIAPINRGYGDSKPSGKRRLVWILVALIALAVIAVAVVVPVYFKVIKVNNNATQSSTGGSGTTTGAAANPTQSSTPETPQSTITGGDGSTVTTETGTFTYKNSFGGFWVSDPADPFNNNAQAQSWSKPLNQTWKYGEDKIYGVNLGGWLVLEPFISPAMYEPYMNATVPAIDEWTLCENLANDPSSGGVAKAIEDHYKTFVTEEDFAQIAGAGLNWIRLPIPFWAIEVYPGEPFLEGVAWKYVLKAIEWARKYGLRINLDLHTIPGSQNGYNHSGQLGPVGWLNGTMGIANAQRTLNYFRIITQFISQPRYRDVVPMFGIVNEAVIHTIGRDVLESFYMEAYDMIRNVTGVGEGNGPWISIHDGFDPLAQWVNFLPGGDRVAMDAHPYFCFGDQDTGTVASQTNKPCTSRGRAFNDSMADFGLTTAGEFSNAFNDCGLFLNGVNRGARYDGTFGGYGGPNAGAGACVKWMDSDRWSAAEKASIKEFALSSFDAMQNFFFWTWKIGNSTTWGTVAAPLWSYKLGLENGWMPTDPREAIGACGNTAPWTGPLPASKTGGAGAGTIPAAYRATRSWPPASLSGVANAATLPTYTATGTLITLAPASYTGGVNAGSGWANTADQQPLYTPVAGCPYPSNAWRAVDATQTVCSGGAATRAIRGRAMPRETGAPA